MAYDFNHAISKESIHNALLKTLGAKISEDDLKRLNQYRRNWNFYEGYHWEEIQATDKPQVTENYIRTFVDKFISFELGGGFNFSMLPEIENLEGENNPYKFLDNVWEYNNKLEKSVELGQAKSITGDGWIQVSFEAKFDQNGNRISGFYDPFDEYEKGKIKVTVLPTSICFPEYSDSHNRDHMERFTVMYPVFDDEEKKFGFTHRGKTRQVMYKQVWTSDRVEIYYKDMNTPIEVIPNKYKVIPFTQIKNYPQQGRNEGLSDIEDLIPLNMELNLKLSDISEIIDYHSAPITAVFGARVGQLERGANKVWGGLPSDARIENLRLEGDLATANTYIDRLKLAMHEVGNIPEGVLGGSMAISNTSGVALQIALMPLLERVKIKQVLTKEGLEVVNKMILLIGEKEGLIKVPEGIKRSDFYKNEVTFNSILPKDGVLELQELEAEMRLGITSREEAMKRRGKGHIQNEIQKIDEDMEINPSLYGKQDIDRELALAEGQAEITKKFAPPQQPTNPNAVGVKAENTEKKVGENKEGQPKKLNAGFTNSPIKKK